MFAYKISKNTRLAPQITLCIIILLGIFIDGADTVTKCHKCNGVNCLRKSYKATEDCTDTLDGCLTVFHGSTVLAQGCFEQIGVELREKCHPKKVHKKHQMDDDEADYGEYVSETKPIHCHQCKENLCNNVSGDGFECIQCDSKMDAKCANNAENLKLEKCPLGRSFNSYCYTRIEGERVKRGCANELKQQKECLDNSDCILCSPLHIRGCNRELKIGGSGPGGGSGGTEGGGSGSGDGSGSGGGSGGTGGGGSGSGEGSESGGSGSGVGSGSGGSGSGGGTGSGGGSGGNGGGGSGGSGSGSGSGGESSGSNNVNGAIDIRICILLTTILYISIANYLA